MQRDNQTISAGPIRVSIHNLSQWQRGIVSEYLLADDRILIVHSAGNEQQCVDATPKEVQLRLVGFDASRPDECELFLKLQNSARTIPIIALVSTPPSQVSCELPSSILNRVCIPVELDVQARSVTQFYKGLLNAMEHSLPQLGNAAHNFPVIADTNQYIELIAIGSSTGGPKALQKILNELPQNLQVPIVITQHMPSNMTTLLARQLDSNSGLTVKEARHDDILKSGHVYIAPGDKHMRLMRLSASEVCVCISDDEPVNFCRPSVDVLFKSAASAYGSNCLGVVLTGMGVDGVVGSNYLVKTGAKVIVQDESSSVVWGMPGRVASAGLASDVVHVDDIAHTLISALSVRCAA